MEDPQHLFSPEKGQAFTEVTYQTRYPTPDPTCVTSATEKEIYGHEIIRKVMQKSMNRTIRHDLSHINTQSQFYAAPRNCIKKEMRFDTIPPKEKLYHSICATKIKDISRKLKEKLDSDQANPQKIPHDQQPHNINQPAIPSRHVAVSGLVSHNFSSVNAERSLGSGKVDHEAKMVAEMTRQARASLSSQDRRKRILSKTAHKKYRQVVRTQQVILSDWAGQSTEAYLQKISNHKSSNLQLFGDKAKKITSIKEYMMADKCPAEDAQFVVNKIEDSLSGNKPKLPAKSKRAVTDEDEVFSRKKSYRARKKVLLRQLSFVD